MKRIGLAGIVLVMLGAGCTFAAPTTTTTLPQPERRVTTTVVPPSTTTAPQPSTTIRTPTPTTLAAIPQALPIVSDQWNWEQLVMTEHSGHARYDGSTLVFAGQPDVPSVEVRRGGQTVIKHVPPDDRNWIIRDVELGDDWVAVVEAEPVNSTDTSHLVVYDLVTANVVIEQTWDTSDGRSGSPRISLSGRYMALIDPLDDRACIDIYDLASQHRFERICGDTPVRTVEMDGYHFAFDSAEGDCISAWTGSLYGQGHDLAEHTNRKCWSNSPTGGDNVTVWFESKPLENSGIDTMIGLYRDNATVSLGKGLRGSAEVCWNRAYWIGGNGDIRMWDGGDVVKAIQVSEEGRFFDVSCNGPWVTYTAADGVYTANMFTASADDACSLVEQSDSRIEAELATALDAWVRTQFDDLPADLEVSVGAALGRDGWWIAGGSFSSHLEGAVFAWSPTGEISLVFSGNGDSEYDVRAAMLSSSPEVPPALLGCIDVAGRFS